MFGKRTLGLVVVVAAGGLLLLAVQPMVVTGADHEQHGGGSKVKAGPVRPFLHLDQTLAAVEKALKGGDEKAALAALAEARAKIAEWRASGSVCAKCAQAAKAAKIVNVKCPMMGSVLKPAKVTADLVRWHKGQKVGFCCAGCPGPWDELSDAEKDKKLATVLPTQSKGVVNSKCPMMGSKIDPASVPASLTRTFNGQKVGFCCAGCPAAWDKLTAAQKAAKLKGSL